MPIRCLRNSFGMSESCWSDRGCERVWTDRSGGIWVDVGEGENGGKRGTILNNMDAGNTDREKIKQTKNRETLILGFRRIPITS